MDKRYTVFRFLSQVFMMYGIIIGLLNLFCIIAGREAASFSTIFSLEGAGLSVATSYQFLLAITIITAIRMLFMTDILIKNMQTGVRIAAMFISAFAVVISFVFLFDWFPANNLLSWVMFILSSVISCIVSIIVSTAAERLENRRLDAALKRAKEKN